MFRHVLRWLATLLKICKRPQCIAKFVRSQADITDLDEETVVIMNDAGLKKWTCFRCPGGCGEKIMLNLSSRRSPCWTADVDLLGRPTIHPSVWQQNGCGCHFWIRNGEVQWCEGGKARISDVNTRRGMEMCKPKPEDVIVDLCRLLRDVAPEKLEELEGLLGEIKPRFVFNETDTRKGMRARPETSEIFVSLPILKRQLAMAFGYVKIYQAVSQLSEESGWIRLQPEGDEQFDTGIRLLQWASIEASRAAAAQGITEGSDEDWPKDLPFPHPESPPDSDARIAIELYYMALATDLHHELNHLRLGHTGESDDAVGQEIDADVQAAEWILSGMSPDDPVFEKRILGVVLSHMYDMFLLLEGFVADPSHPPLAARLWHRPDHYLVGYDNHAAWMFIAASLSVHCGLANQPRPIDNKMQFDTARAAVDYLLNLYDPPQA